MPVNRMMTPNQEIYCAKSQQSTKKMITTGVSTVITGTSPLNICTSSFKFLAIFSRFWKQLGKETRISLMKGETRFENKIELNEFSFTKIHEQMFYERRSSGKSESMIFNPSSSSFPREDVGSCEERQKYRTFNLQKQQYSLPTN